MFWEGGEGDCTAMARITKQGLVAECLWQGRHGGLHPEQPAAKLPRGGESSHLGL